MKGVKFGIVFAVSGFLLSFISGLFSHTFILYVLLKALLAALIFGVLGFLISLIYSNFLDDSSGGFGAESDGGYQTTTAAPAKGQVVDITVQDDELDRGESENHFVVGDNHQMLNNSDVRKQQTVNGAEGNTASSDNGFVPLKRKETFMNVAGKEALSPNAGRVNNGNSDLSSSSLNDDKKIDTLPDMSNFEFSDNSSSSSSDEDVENGTGSDFVSSGSAHKKNNEVPEVKDASLIAKAISSVLADEESL